VSGSTTRSYSTSEVPITEHEEFSEESGRQFYTLEEEWERVVALLHGLDKRQALVRIYNRGVLNILTPHVQPEQNDHRLRRFLLAAFKRNPNVLPVEKVVAEIE